VKEAFPKVLVAILAKDKEPVLPLFLRCIDALDYPPDRIVLWVRTNNNRDSTARLLHEWLQQKGTAYAGCVWNEDNVPERVQDYAPHEWNSLRLDVLQRIRQESMAATLQYDCDYYCVIDCDNYCLPHTLRDLVNLQLPIVAPMLRHVDYPRNRYANYHHAIDANGYFADSPEYDQLLNRHIRGIVEVRVVHCTYLVRADAIPKLTYLDGTGRHEYVVWSHSARKARIPQYLDNREIYGWLTLDEKPESVAAATTLIKAEMLRSWASSVSAQLQSDCSWTQSPCGI
jgi:hypothetical protein